MKVKDKKEISDSSDSEANENLHSFDQNANPDKNLKSKTFFEQKPIGKSVNENIDCHEAPFSNSGVQQDSGSESSSEKIPQEITTNLNSSENSFNEKSCTVNSIFNVKELTPDDEIYLLQCPENYTKQDLCNKNLDFTKFKQSIILNGEAYKLELINSEKKYITLAVPEKTNKGSLVKLLFKGHIIIQKDVKIVSSKPEDGKVSDLHKVAFPNDIKIRHPLLGAEWKSYIESVNTAIKKNKSAKTKSKKIRQENNQGNLEGENKKLKRENSQSEIVQKKKKRNMTYNKIF